MCARPSSAEPSTMSSMIIPRSVAGGDVLATWVITAPPREWPIKRMGGFGDQESLVAVEERMKRRSAERVSRVRSRGVEGDEVVRPWERASIERMPAVGRWAEMDLKKVAKDRPDEPAP